MPRRPWASCRVDVAAARRRLPVVHGAQVLRTQGHRRVVRARERRGRRLRRCSSAADMSADCARARCPRTRSPASGAAAALARAQGAADAAHARDLARRGSGRELETIPGASFNHRREQRSARADQCLVSRASKARAWSPALPEIAVSTGSACSSATREPSYVLRALGRSTELAQSSLRLSLGRFTTAAEVDAAATAIRGEVVAPACCWRATPAKARTSDSSTADSSLAPGTACWRVP